MIRFFASLLKLHYTIPIVFTSFTLPMKLSSYRSHKRSLGFTLIEILLVVAAIAVLAGIVIVAINPTKTLAQMRNAERQSEINTIYKAVSQYLITNPTGLTDLGITSDVQDICAPGESDDCLSLDSLTPYYLAEIPTDPQASGALSGYQIRLNTSGNWHIVQVDFETYGELDQYLAVGGDYVEAGSGSAGSGGGGGGGSYCVASINGGYDYSYAYAQNGFNNAQVYPNGQAFAALKTDGSVVTWGSSLNGGDSSSVSADLASGVSKIFSTGNAFAALKTDGSVVTWGSSSYGGDSSSVSASLASGVSTIYSNTYAFDALKTDGSVVTWGESSYGGNSPGVDFTCE